MNVSRTTSFSEVTLVEAVARLATITVSLRPVPPTRHRRLTSRLLGLDDAGNLVLAVPTAGKEKVFIPVGWDLGLFFPVGEFMLQALTQVVGHTLYRFYTDRRVDALVVRRPEKLLSLNQRSQGRVEVGDSVNILATLWPDNPAAMPGRDSCALPRESQAGMPELPGRDAGAALATPCLGRLANRSDSGLGLLFQNALPFPPGQAVIVRIEDPASSSGAFYRARLKHCTRQPTGGYLAGLGDLSELGPGQDVLLLQHLSRC